MQPFLENVGQKTRLDFSLKRRAQNETRFFVFVETRSKTRKGICLEKDKSIKVRKISPEKIAMHCLQNIKQGK